MLELSNLRIELDDAAADARAAGLVPTMGVAGPRATAAVARALGISPKAIADIKLVKRSVDARKRNDVHFVGTFAFSLDAAQEQRLLDRGVKGPLNLKRHQPYQPLDIPSVAGVRPVVCGSGPAGLFAAWVLAHAGLRPIVLERGSRVEERMARVDAFDQGGPLDPECNIQFGEGGAGTFSDGKLTTNVKNPLCRDVLHIFAQCGAPDEILWQAKPHIGTDQLVGVVRTMRARIEELGAEFRFDTRLDSVGRDQSEDGALLRVACSDGSTLCTDTLILATGHSARDTFAMLHEAGLAMEPKPFSVGVRVEHLQSAIDKAQYGSAAGHPALGAADYKLAVHLPDGRGVYTFCMCPGGQVVCAASEEGGVVVNGMSRHARDGRNANAALLVGITPEDFGGSEADPLAGVRFQRDLEQQAYQAAVAAGGAPYQAPAQRVGDFLAGHGSPSSRGGAPRATYARGVVAADLRRVLPGYICDSLQQAIPLLDRRLHGYADPDALMTAVETRSSSPVRIVRDESFQASVPGIYPTGEGAGYAGGIMSAAADGLRVALSIVRSRAGHPAEGE